MIYRRFTIICLISMVFGIGFANLVQSVQASRDSIHVGSISCLQSNSAFCATRRF